MKWLWVLDGFDERRDFEAKYYSLADSDILVAEYINGEFKIAGENKE